MSILKPDQHETDFMRDIDAALHLRPAMPAVLTLLGIVGLVIALMFWAAFAQIDELTRGEGQVVPTQEVQMIQSLEGGVIQDILVKEGESVEAGQVILRISDVQFSSQERGLEGKRMALEAQKARLRAEIDATSFAVSKPLQGGYPDIVANERALFQSRQKELTGTLRVLDDRASKARAEMAEVDAQISRLGQTVSSLEEELNITRGLVASRAVPKLEELRVERELNDARGQISAQRERKRALEAERRAALSEKSNTRDRFRSQALAELSEVEADIATLQEDIKSAGDRVDRAEIRSPVDGVVNRLAVNTIGGVVEPAQPLAEIVPLGDELKIVAKVTPEDIAFLRRGQAARVSLTAYDPQKYGRLDAQLTRIGANSITDEQGEIFFEIEVQTARNFLGSEAAPLPIMPGMVASVDIITGKRTILDYLLKPILRARSVALTER